MPNRDLKDTNRRSTSLQVISDAAERLWYRLITAVDDFGRLEADPEVVFTSCFQRVPKGWTIKKVEACLKELATTHPSGEAPMIYLYSVGVRQYLQIVSAEVHIYRRAKDSKYPAPPISMQKIKDAHICPQMPADSLDLRTPNPESRVPNSESRTPVADATGRFEEFWSVFPDRGGKKLEREATRLLFFQLLPEAQLLAITAARHYADGIKQQGISAKDPKRFLRDGKGHEPWLDWIEPAKPAPSPSSPPQQKCEWVSGGKCEAYAMPRSKYCQEHKEKLLKIQARMGVDERPPPGCSDRGDAVFSPNLSELVKSM